MPKKTASTEFMEFVVAFRKQNPWFFYSLLVSVVIFFIPGVNLLVPIYWAFSVFRLLKNRVTGVFLRIFISVIALIFFILPVSAYNNSVLVDPQEIQKREQAEQLARDEQTKRQQAEQLANEEKAKREQEERARKELEDKISQSQKINFEYDVESDLGSQNPELAQQANLSIAPLGNDTKDEKLFDVVEVVDGDTIKISEIGTLRLIGMDTPETKDPRKPVQCFGVEASNKAKELLSGKKVYLEFDPSNRIDKYGRTLAYVYREDGYFYNKEMIKEGYANSYIKYPHPKMDEFNQVAQEARDAQRGLYSPTTCNGDTTKAAETPKSEPKSQSTPSANSTTSTPTPIPVSVPVSTPTENGDVFYANCTEVKNAGKAPIRRGEPGYSSKLDRDGDGIACEN